MTERSVTAGASLEARPAALLVQAAGRFSSEIMISVDNRTVNAKSIMGIFSLGILAGQTVKISCNGSDELQAANELERFFK